jgi:hypothetical protein
MRDDDSPGTRIGDDHLCYAVWLARGTTVGFVVMAIAFVAYIAGVIEPQVPLAELPLLWREPAEHYLAATGIANGWGWARLLDKGDMLSLVGVAALSGCSVLSLLAVAPVYLRQRKRLLAGVCVAEVVVIALAASNFLSASH